MREYAHRSLAISSNRPVLIIGTFDQHLRRARHGPWLQRRQTISLISLRQKSDAYRSNLIVTNGAGRPRRRFWRICSTRRDLAGLQFYKRPARNTKAAEAVAHQVLRLAGRRGSNPRPPA